MKKLTISFIMFAFCMSHVPFIMGQWEWQNPYPQGYRLSSVCFIDGKNGWAVGGSGTIIHTSDGGNTWEIQNQSSFFIDYCDVCFTDPNNGWVVGYGILHTRDGGRTWESIGIDQNRPGPYYGCVSFTDSLNGWIIGSEIFHTSDGGGTWETQDSGLEYGLTSIFFRDPYTGWAVGSDGAIIHTTDGGNNWTQQSSGTNIVLTGVFFIDLLNGWVVGDSRPGENGIILHTSDAGNTWEIQYTISNDSSLTLHGVSFADHNNGWAVGTLSTSISPYTWSSVILHTTDGGITWDEKAPATYRLADVCCFYPNECWIVGELGIILRASDSGNTWEELSRGVTNNTIYDIFFVDSLKGWAVSGYDDKENPVYVIMHTEDGGISWGEQLTDTTQPYTSVFFIDSLNGWTIGSGGILHTSDGGYAWEEQLNAAYLNRIFFTDTENGWAVGSGPILNTTDGGITWEEQAGGMYHDLDEIYFSDPYNGWTVGGSIVLRTSNGGKVWETQWSGNIPCEDACLIDSIHGYTIGNKYINHFWHGIIHQTSDGGATWQELPSIDGPVSRIFFTDPNTGWIVGQNWGLITWGYIMHTTDGGITWNEQYTTGYDHYLKSIYFIDSFNGWVGGEKGTILHTYNGGMIGVKEPSLGIQNSKFKIQNFPNPFSDNTTIEFYLPEDRHVTLKIYDLLGREIETLVSGWLERGEHAYILKSCNMKSGIYLCRFVAGEEAVVGKIILNH